MANNPTGSSSDISPLSIMSSDGAQKPLTAEEKARYEELRDQRDFLNNKAKIALRHSVDARRRYDYEWMVRDLFRRGYQFSRYQPSTQTVILASRQTARVPINMVASQMRSIRNQVTSFRPKFETLPKHPTDESRTQARYAGKILDYYFDKLNFKRKIKETVTQGLMYSIGGPWQIVYDKDKKDIKVWLIDPFDFYFDMLAEELEECEFVIKAVRRPLNEVIYNPRYNSVAKKEVGGGEAKLAVSEYKQFMLQSLKYVTQYNREEAPTVILYEGDFKIRDEETGKVHIRKVIWTDQNFTPLLYEDTDEEEYDYVLYSADLNPKDILGESWMKHVMPINRVINSLESSVFDYNYKVAKGRIVVDRDSGVRAIHNQHGEIISKNRGAEVRALDIPPLPVATGAQIERMWRYGEDIGGVHDPSLGRVTPGSRSGVLLAEAKQSDATNQDDLVDNMEDFLTDVARKILKKISDNVMKVQVIHALGYRESESEYFAVVSEKSKIKGKTDQSHKGQIKIGPDWLDLAVIGDINNVRVTIGSWLGYTKEAMQEQTMKLLQLGAIDQKTFLKLWEFGDVENIVQQTRTESILKAHIQAQAKPGEVEQVDPYVENDMMVLEGKDMPVDMHDDHWVHVAVHQEALGQGRDDLVGKHIQIHQMYMGQAPQSPQPGEANLGVGTQVPQGVNPQDASRQQTVAAQQQPQVPPTGGGGAPMSSGQVGSMPTMPQG